MTKTGPLRKIPTKWDAVVLVCKACRKRSNGPQDLRPKELVSEARHASKAEDRRVRVLQTGCIGLCPNKATAVAVMPKGADPYLLVVAAEGELAATLAS